MKTAFIIGNIASGKSTASRYLESRGARRIDLDVLAKGLYVPGSALVEQLAEAFGWDILNEDGDVTFSVLADRAFATPEQTELLNSIVHPAVLNQLSTILLPAQCCSTVVPRYELTVVEISAAVAFTEAFGLADEVIAITAPLEIRRGRAIERGMSADDFDARAAVQPKEEDLCALASLVIDNTNADDSLFAALDSWLSAQRIELQGVESHA